MYYYHVYYSKLYIYIYIYIYIILLYSDTMLRIIIAYTVKTIK